MMPKTRKPSGKPERAHQSVVSNGMKSILLRMRQTFPLIRECLQRSQKPHIGLPSGATALRRSMCPRGPATLHLQIQGLIGMLYLLLLPPTAWRTNRVLVFGVSFQFQNSKRKETAIPAKNQTGPFNRCQPAMSVINRAILYWVNLTPIKMQPYVNRNGGGNAS